MDVTRRHFLALGQWLAVAAALPSKVFGASLLTSFGKAGKTRLSSFTMQTFLPLVNSSFPVVTGSATRNWLTLLSVEDKFVRFHTELRSAFHGSRRKAGVRPTQAPKQQISGRKTGHYGSEQLRCPSRLPDKVPLEVW